MMLCKYTMSLVLATIAFAENPCPNKCRCEAKTKSFLVYCYGVGFSNLPQNISDDVTFLLLSFNRIRSLTNGMFLSFRKLDHIVISHNVIEEVQSNAFDGLHNLIRLDLSGNCIRHFPWSFISITHQLSFLALDNNNITNFPPAEQLDGLKRLKTFRIHDNRLVCSCQVYPFAEWVQENGRGATGVTISKPDHIKCISRLGWINSRILSIRLPASDHDCVLPEVKIFADTSTVSRASLAPLVSLSAASVTSFPNGTPHNKTIDIDSRTKEPEGYRDALSPWNLQVEYLFNENHTVPAKLFTQQKSGFMSIYVFEKSALKLTCNVTNIQKFPIESNVILRTSVIYPESVDETIVWSEDSSFRIPSVSQKSHDRLRLICGVESIAGTVTRQAMVYVIPVEEKTPKATSPSSPRTRQIKDRDKATTSNVSLDEAGAGGTTTTTRMSSSSATIYRSQCRDNYDGPIVRLKATNSSGEIKYKYSFGNVINVTMKENYVDGGIVVTLTTERPNFEIYICHSHGNSVLRRRSKLKGKNYTMIIRSSSVVAPFIVCVLSTYFNEEVCGNFTVPGNMGRSIFVMAIVGGFLMALAIIPMTLAAIHHIYMSKNPYSPTHTAKIRKLPPMDDYWRLESTMSTSYRRIEKQTNSEFKLVEEQSEDNSAIVTQIRSTTRGEAAADGRFQLAQEAFDAAGTTQHAVDTSSLEMNTDASVAKWLQSVNPDPCKDDFQYDEDIVRSEML